MKFYQMNKCITKKADCLHPLLMISIVTFSGLGNIVEALDVIVVARKD